MKKIVSYYLIRQAMPEDLSNVVTNMLSKGWELYGPPTIAVGPCYNYIQAMVRYDEVAK